MPQCERNHRVDSALAAERFLHKEEMKALDFWMSFVPHSPLLSIAKS